MKLAIKLLVATSTVVCSFAIAQSAATNDKVVAKVLKESFAERGSAKLDRLNQTAQQAACSKANALGKPIDKVLSKAQLAKLQKAAMDGVKYPEDGKFIGDWKEGERIAQNGRGLQWSDAAGSVNGANCYACHQLSPAELSFGNLGPTLQKYATLRGVKDPNSKEAEPIVKYTWQRIWNTHAFNACAGMPRFGDAGILTMDQIKHVMALLLDTESPVNK